MGQAKTTQTAVRTGAVLECRNYINGRWVASKGRRRLEIRDPADNSQHLGSVVMSTRGEVHEAIEAAHEALPEWRSTPGPKRAKLLLEVMHALEERKEEFARTIVEEEGKIHREAMASAQRSIDSFEFATGEGRRLRGIVQESGVPHVLAYALRQPLGVVSLITPWNFPLAIPCWKMAPALITGNTVVLKPSPFVPISPVKLFEVLDGCGFPPGVVNLVHGDVEAGEEMIDNPLVKGVSFTGSTPGGKSVYRRAMERGLKVQCQMGAKNAFVVLADADLDRAAKGAVDSGLGSSGQRCMATSRVVVEKAVGDELVKKMVDYAATCKVGSGMDPEVIVGPAIHADHMRRIIEYIEIGKDEGAELVFGGVLPDDPALGKGTFAPPAIFDHVTPNMRIFQEEIFGPIISVTRANDLEDALRLSNSTDFGMAATVFTERVEAAMKFAQDVEAGLVTINIPMLPPQPQFPFGGVKGSGFGTRDQGDTAIDFFTEWKVISMRHKFESDRPFTTFR